MGWFQVDHVAARVRRLGTLSVALVKSGGKNGRVALRLRLSRNVQEAAGMAAGDTLDIRWGDREKAGRVLLTKAEGGTGAAQLRLQHPDKPAAIETRFGAIPDGHFPGADGTPTFLVLEPRPAVPCPWSVAAADDGARALEVTLPKAWFSAPPAGTGPVSRQGQPTTAPPRPATLTDLARERAEVEEATRPASRPFPTDFAPPRPAADDRIERVIRLLERGLSTEEVRQHERCSPQFVHDCRAELAKRKPGRVHPGQRTGAQPQMAGTRERSEATA